MYGRSFLLLILLAFFHGLLQGLFKRTSHHHLHSSHNILTTSPHMSVTITAVIKRMYVPKKSSVIFLSFYPSTSGAFDVGMALIILAIWVRSNDRRHHVSGAILVPAVLHLQRLAEVGSVVATVDAHSLLQSITPTPNNRCECAHLHRH